MESLISQGLIHIYGTLLWISTMAVLTVEMLRTFRKEESGKSKNSWSLKAEMMALITTTLAGSTGLFLQYEWDLWKSLAELEFWWVHSMIMVWILFSIVFFLLDPLFLKKMQ